MSMRIKMSRSHFVNWPLSKQFLGEIVKAPALPDGVLCSADVHHSEAILDYGVHAYLIWWRS